MLPPDNGGFYRVDAVPVAVLGPDDQQRAVGQDWAASLVYLPLSGDAAAPLRIDHSPRGAWHHPVDSRLFTVCWEQAVPALFGNCFAPNPFDAPRAYQPGPRRKRQPRPAGTSPSPPSDRRPRSTAETSTFNSSRFDPTPPGGPC
jgi:hypothetical protein